MASDGCTRPHGGQQKARAAKVLATMRLLASDAIRLPLARVATENALPFGLLPF